MDGIFSIFTLLLLLVILSAFLAVGISAVVYLLFLNYKFRDREKAALDSTLLQIALPRDNEIKIDAAEQLFSSFASLHQGGSLSFLKPQPSLSLEIVGMPGDIRFYVSTPNKIKDYVEKQINGAYPDAEILEVNEEKSLKEGFIVGNDYNIFAEDAKVSFASLRLKKADYFPIKLYKDLATDPLSSITSILAKMTEGEGAAIQIMISPADDKWKKHGKAHLSETKKGEANPETAKYSADPKEMEGIEASVSKPGFNTVVRIVVSSSTKESADAHLSNMVNVFSQFSGLNSFTKNKIRMKKAFMSDFIYRYMPRSGQTAVMTSEELATVYHFPNKTVATPNIHWVNSKRAPAAAHIPTSGLLSW